MECSQNEACQWPWQKRSTWNAMIVESNMQVIRRKQKETSKPTGNYPHMAKVLELAPCAIAIAQHAISCLDALGLALLPRMAYGYDVITSKRFRITGPLWGESTGVGISSMRYCNSDCGWYSDGTNADLSTMLTYQQCWLTTIRILTNPPPPLVPHICVSDLGEHCACSAPSHYLNQCWLIVKPTPSNTLQWNSNQSAKLFIHENASKHVVCEMVVILSRGRCQLWNILSFISKVMVVFESMGPLS